MPLFVRSVGNHATRQGTAYAIHNHPNEHNWVYITKNKEVILMTSSSLMRYLLRIVSYY